MAVQRICQKLEKDGKPHKFPPPAGKTHVLLVDFRTFKNGGDKWDRAHIGLGGESVPEVFRNHYEGRLVSGVFDTKTTLKGAAQARERLHFIGFVNEKSYEDGSFGPPSSSSPTPISSSRRRKPTQPLPGGRSAPPTSSTRA